MKIKCRECGQLFDHLSYWRSHCNREHGGTAEFDVQEEEGDFKPNITPTPKLADECKKILDNGWNIQLWANPLGSYSARAMNDHGTVVDTDDFEPSAALYRLTEKVFGRIV